MEFKHSLSTILLIIAATCDVGVCCQKGNKAVGVCLHVYLERDFLPLENIVYPSEERRQRNKKFSEHRKYYQSGGADWNREEDFTSKRRAAELAVGRRRTDWIEGPELEQHCERIRTVLDCFEEVLVDCDSSYDFFRYRHLLYALSEAHKFLCATPHIRENKFLRFLQTIECVEEARREEATCQRRNVSSVVWNKILRGEVGDEICDSLSTQRACLLENKYIHEHCNKNKERVEIYSDLSHYFLSIWCGHPLHPRLRHMLRVDYNNTSMALSGGRQRRSTWISIVIPFLSLILSLSTHKRTIA